MAESERDVVRQRRLADRIQIGFEGGANALWQDLVKRGMVPAEAGRPDSEPLFDQWLRGEVAEIKLISLNNDGLWLSHAWLFGLILDWCFDFLDGAPNFTERTIELTPSAVSQFRDGLEAIVLTVRRKRGKTPGQIAREFHDALRELHRESETTLAELDAAGATRLEYAGLRRAVEAVTALLQATGAANTPTGQDS